MTCARGSFALAVCVLIAGPAAAGDPSVGDTWVWDLPPGFPAPRVPADNPMSAAKVELGRHLFYDRRLSGNGRQACADCHQQARAFTDGRARAVGSTGEVHPHAAMSLANVAYLPTLTWADPSLRSLEAQARVPMFNRDPVELGLAGRERQLLARLRADGDYRQRFAAAFPRAREAITVAHVTKALASFERTLISGSSPFDRWVYLDDRDALSASARRGMALFFSERLACARCHGGFNLSGPVVSEATRKRVRPVFHNTGLYDLRDRRGRPGAYPELAPGLVARTGRRRDSGRFRAPTLRNVALTAPYMHDGSIATLEGVLAHYAAGGRSRDNPFKSPRLRGFALDAGARGDLLAFLDSLTDRAFVEDPRYADPHAGESGHADRGGGVE